MSRSGILALILCSVAGAAEPIHYVVQLSNAADQRPVAGARVRLDERIAWSDAAGVARFEWLTAAASQLVVDSPDFERVDRAAGPGGSTELSLTPARRQDLVCTCVLAGGDQVAPGARVVLERLDRRFPVLPLEGIADFAGRVPFRGLPQGVYSVAAQALGCEPVRLEVQIGGSDAAPAVGGEVAQRVELAPTAAIFQIEVSSEPAASIEAVAPGESAVLETIAAATCDAAGRCTIDVPARLRGVRSSPHRAVLRASKAGFVPTHVAVEYGDTRGTLAIPLTPAVPSTPEREPNDTVAAATPAPWSGEITFRPDSVGDHDLFAIAPTEDGMLNVRVEVAPMALALVLRDEHGRERERRNAYAGNPLDGTFDLTAGRWFLELAHWGDSEVATAPIAVKLAWTSVPDAHERNGEAASAAEITPGIVTWGAIFPRGDDDCYRVRVASAGLLQLDVPTCPLALHCAVTGPRGELVAEVSAYGGNPLALLARLPAAGAYTIMLQHWGDTEASVVAYRLGVEFAPADDGELRELELPLDATVAGSISPIADHDRWRLDVRESGTLRVRLAPHLLPTTIRVLAPDGATLATASAHGGNPCECVVSLQRPGLHWVDIGHWGDTADSPIPYVLSCAFFPNDPWDSRRNESAAASSRVSLTRVVTGAIATVGDDDVYRFIVPRRAVLTAGMPPHPLSMQTSLLGPAGGEPVRAACYGGNPHQLVAQVHTPGTHWLTVQHWGDSDWSPARYRLSVRLDLEDPFEPNDRPGESTTLGLAGAIAGTILPVGDVDNYRIDLARGLYRTFVSASPLAKSLRIRGAGGKDIATQSAYGGNDLNLEWENPVPQTCWLELRHWGDSDASVARHVLYTVPAKAPAPPRAVLSVTAGEQPQTFVLAAGVQAEGEAASFDIDANGDGRSDYQLGAAGSVTHRYAVGAIYPVLLHARGATGDSWDFAWVDARDPALEPDVSVEFLRPAAESVLENDTEVSFDAWGRDGSGVAGAELFLDEEPLGRWSTPPFTAVLPVARIAGRVAKLRAAAWSARGWRAEAELAVSAPPLVALVPADGAHITAGAAAVEWSTAEDGPSEVVVTGGVIGERVFAGAPGRSHRVMLTGLEPGASYVWRARTGTLESKPRTIVSVRGLEFAERSYEARVARDYDQKGVVRVVNHGDEPAGLTLRVESEQQDLLVGFVGEGSPDKTVTLEPGEYQDVLLGISAQDAMEEAYVFRVSLEGTLGEMVHTDAVEFTAHVILPNIDYEARVLDQDPGTLTRVIQVTNRGDTIADFRAELDPAGAERAALIPAIEHARIETGQTIELQVAPRLSPDWTDFTCALRLRGVQVRKEVELSFALPEGKHVYLATVASRQDNRAADWICTNRPDVATVVTVPEGPQIGQPVSTFMPPRGLVPTIPEPSKDPVDRADDDDFWPEDVVKELEKIQDPDKCKEARLRAALATRFINRRLRTFNRVHWGILPSWPAVTYHAPGFDGTDLRSAVDVLRGPGVSMGFGSDVAMLAWSLRAGACAEHTALMRHLLNAAGTTNLTVLESRAGHDFVGVCLAEGADPDRPWTWGPDAFLADSWLQGNLSPQDAWREDWMFGEGQAAVYSLGGGKPPSSGLGTSRALYQHALNAGPDWIKAHFQELKDKLPASYFNPEGTDLLPDAGAPPAGWLEGNR